VVHNYEAKKSLQNFTSFVQPCGNNITMLQSTTNLQTLKELQSIEASLKYHHNPTQKKYNKKRQIQKRKEQKNGLPLNSQITQHCTSWGNNWVPD
jgi:hypothetical protein